MTDEVNKPAHYNKQGIEVIEVIEAYTPDSPHLANVLKYVCRHSYKGNALQDLRKAQWYLSRKIELLEAEQATAEWEAAPLSFDWNGIDRGVSDWTLDDIKEPTPEEFIELLEQVAQAMLDEVEIEDALKDESWLPDGAGIGLGVSDWTFDDVVDPNTGVQAHLPPDRIAGDDDAAKRIKDAYYSFDRFEIRGYCASCDAEISATQPFVKDHNQFDEGLMFCTPQCLASLKEWQKDWTL